MRLPRPLDFLIEFGIEPVEVDPGLGSQRYVLRSADQTQEMDFYLSAIEESFGIILRFGDKEAMRVYSERLYSFRIWSQEASAGVHAIFQLGEAWAEATLTIYPEFRCNWQTLEGAGPPNVAGA